MRNIRFKLQLTTTALILSLSSFCNLDVYANEKDIKPKGVDKSRVEVLNEQNNNLEENINKDKEKIDNTQIINIEDNNLKIAINKELKKSDLNSSITQKEIESIKTISAQNASSKNIKNLSGLEYAINLEYIDLSNNNIKDISYIKALIENGNLKKANISNQVIKLEKEDIKDTKYYINNNIININSKIVKPIFINNNGKYIDDKILWDNLQNLKTYNLECSFKDDFKDKQSEILFSVNLYKDIYVHKNCKPNIKASDKTIKINDSFNPLIGVSAYDYEDKDITRNIKVVKNDVNTKKAGNYQVVYEVADSSNQKDTKTINVKVENIKNKNNKKENIIIGLNNKDNDKKDNNKNQYNDDKNTKDYNYKDDNDKNENIDESDDSEVLNNIKPSEKIVIQNDSGIIKDENDNNNIKKSEDKKEEDLKIDYKKYSLGVIFVVAGIFVSKKIQNML